MPSTTTSKTHALILRRVVAVQQNNVAAAMGWDVSKTSRFFSSNAGVNIEELEKLFSSLGLTVIESDGDMVTMTRQEYESIRFLARKCLED